MFNHFFSPCEHHCRNLPDRHECYCASGYEPDEDNPRQCHRSRDFYASMAEQSKRRQFGQKPEVTTDKTATVTARPNYAQRSRYRPNQGYYKQRNFYQRRAPQPNYRYNTSARRPQTRSHTYPSHSPTGPGLER